MMHLYIPAIEGFDQPACSECGTPMRLFAVESYSGGALELHSFDCPRCCNIETQWEKFRVN